MARRKGNFATKFLGPTTGGRGRGPNTGPSGYRPKKRKEKKGIYGEARRRK